MRTIFTLAAAIASSLPTQPKYAVPASAECHFPHGAAIGCLDGEPHAGPNAVTMYENYGTELAKLSQDYVLDYARQFGCGGIRDSRYVAGLKITVLGRYRAVTPDGYAPVDRVSVLAPNRARIYWIDERFLTGNCPRLSPDKGGDPTTESEKEHWKNYDKTLDDALEKLRANAPSHD